jgi:hypothetical protein
MSLLHATHADPAVLELANSCSSSASRNCSFVHNTSCTAPFISLPPHCQASFIAHACCCMVIPWEEGVGVVGVGVVLPTCLALRWAPLVVCLYPPHSCSCKHDDAAYSKRLLCICYQTVGAWLCCAAKR